jgi:hypothetical protein
VRTFDEPGDQNPLRTQGLVLGGTGIALCTVSLLIETGAGALLLGVVGLAGIVVGSISLRRSQRR